MRGGPSCRTCLGDVDTATTFVAFERYVGCRDALVTSSNARSYYCSSCYCHAGKTFESAEDGSKGEGPTTYRPSPRVVGPGGYSTRVELIIQEHYHGTTGLQSYLLRRRDWGPGKYLDPSIPCEEVLGVLGIGWIKSSPYKPWKVESVHLTRGQPGQW